MPVEFRRVREIFLEALEAGSPEERAARVGAACAGDDDLRREVEGLLRRHEQAGNFLEPPSHRPAITVVSGSGGKGAGPAAADVPGNWVGPYKLLQQLGEGGMGAVWVAEETEPVKRRVALKLIKPGMDTVHVLRRFEQERQALALMDHPNIAKVLDAGSTDQGRPYFVMELVKGVPITKYCDELHLSVRERLELFVPVCRAIQHAHQKGIIHRDVKPSNVLVCLQDGKPVPKVIDFGVAKALHQRLTEQTVYTEVGQVMGTLEYMSPEQAELSPLDVDTRADVYALGVLLYELLTGTTPLDRSRLRGAGYSEALRLIREEEPPRPSTRLTQSGEALAGLAARRRTEPGRLARQLRGEIDWIVMKCLEKDRTRRYETANGLARDIERYLADEPVEACPPSRWYRLAKVARRHRAGVVMSAAMAVLLVGGTLGTSVGLVRARRAQAEAEAARRRTREALDALTDDVVGQLLGQRGPLGEQEQAFLRKAQRLYEDLAHSEGTTEQARADRAAGLYRVAQVRQRLGDLHEAEAACREALALQQQLAADFPAVPEYRRDLARSHNNLGMLLARGRPGEAETAYRTALALLEKLAADFPAVPEYRLRLAGGYNNLGILLKDAHRLPEAEAAYQEALHLARRLADDAPSVPEYRRYLAGAHTNLGNVLADQGKTKEAEAAYQEALALHWRLVADVPRAPDYANELAGTLINLARLRDAAGDHAGARRLLEEAVPHHRAALQANPRHPAYCRFFRDNRKALGFCLVGLGEHAAAADAAEDLVRQACEPGPDDYNAACILARCVPLAEKDARLSDPERQATARRYGDRALALLREAVKAGWKDAAHLKNDPDMDPVRGRPDFGQLLAELEKTRPATAAARQP